MKNVFDQKDVSEIINRIENLSPTSQLQWGKMNVGQILAHCNVTYESELDKKHPASNGFSKFMMKLFVKYKVVNDKPYTNNLRTAPEFLIPGQKDFDNEEARLITYINQKKELGVAHFDNKPSHSFGSLSQIQWDNLFSKHLDHHLTQFSV